MKILILLISLLSVPALAQVETQEPPEKPRYITPESAYYYIRSGTSVGSVGGEQSSFVLGALGTKRYADEFYYGIEISTHFGAKEYQTTLVNYQMGHHFLTWRHRIKPYIGINFGYGTIKDTTDANRPGASGINIGADLGFDIWSAGMFKIFSGVKFDHMITDNPEVKGSNFVDLYMGFGIRF